MKRVIYFLTGAILMLAASCASPEVPEELVEDEVPEELVEDENIVPGAVSNVQVENVNGGAIITYDLPSIEDLLGAKVVYSLTPDGELIEQSSSAGKNTIVLEGFGDTNERIFTIYAVHKNGNVSEGIPVTIKPLTPPIILMRETLEASAVFGGVKITWDNPLGKDMNVALYVEDSITHEMNLWSKYQSTAIDGEIIFRDIAPETQNFRVEMFDSWENYAEPLDITLTLLEETRILSRDEADIPIWALFDEGSTGDDEVPHRFLYRCDGHQNIDDPENTNYFEQALDWPYPAEKWPWPWYTTGQYTQNKYVPGAEPTVIPWPVYFTFDMGKKAVYSRLIIQAFKRTPTFSSDFPVEFDVWGTNNAKTIEEVEDPNGVYPKGSREANQAYWSSWKIVNGTDAWKNDWVKIGSFKYLTEAGQNQYYEGMPLTAQDISAYENGFEYEFNMDVSEPYRYLRWEVKATSTAKPVIRILAIAYWGSYADDE